MMANSGYFGCIRSGLGARTSTLVCVLVCNRVAFLYGLGRCIVLGIAGEAPNRLKRMHECRPTYIALVYLVLHM